MKETFEICTVLALVMSVFKIVILSFSERLAKVFQFITDIAILLILLSSIMRIKPYQIDIYRGADINYEEIENSSVLEIISSAEELIDEQICKDVEREFSISPSDCKAQINPENYELISLKIYFSKENVMLSTYEVKEFIKGRYSVKCEVIFE